LIKVKFIRDPELDKICGLVNAQLSTVQVDLCRAENPENPDDFRRTAILFWSGTDQRKTEIVDKSIDAKSVDELVAVANNWLSSRQNQSSQVSNKWTTELSEADEEWR
jgi:hypothetical protein